MVVENGPFFLSPNHCESRYFLNTLKKYFKTQWVIDVLGHWDPLIFPILSHFNLFSHLLLFLLPHCSSASLAVMVESSHGMREVGGSMLAAPFFTRSSVVLTQLLPYSTNFRIKDKLYFLAANFFF